MHGQRPDPDELLTRLQVEASKRRRGKLKIFFGATAGVGKTYSMLDAAHTRQSEGIDVVVGAKSRMAGLKRKPFWMGWKRFRHEL